MDVGIESLVTHQLLEGFAFRSDGFYRLLGSIAHTELDLLYSCLHLLRSSYFILFHAFCLLSRYVRLEREWLCNVHLLTHLRGLG